MEICYNHMLIIYVSFHSLLVSIQSADTVYTINYYTFLQNCPFSPLNEFYLLHFIHLF